MFVQNNKIININNNNLPPSVTKFPPGDRNKVLINVGLIVGIDKETMASKETENGSENNLSMTFLPNTSHKSLSTELLAP